MDYIESLLRKKTTFSGVAIDTNLLLVLLCGIYDKKLIGTLKRISDYTESDFYKICIIIEKFGNDLITTTNVISEVCNLTDTYNTQTEHDFFNFIGQLLQPKNHQVSLIDVYHVPRQIYLDNVKAFIKLGMTDAGMLSLAKNNYLVLTADLPLYHFITVEGYDAINYTHLRFQ